MTDHNREVEEDTDPTTPSEPVLIGGTRDVRGTLIDPDGSACVVACPPHPRMGGTRSDRRLTAVCDVLGSDGIASLRFDYGEWDEGHGEYTDTLNAIAWANDRYERVGLYGFSFGGTLALVAATETPVVCVCALAPGANVAERDATDALKRIDCPVNIVYGERDTTADWEPVVEQAKKAGHSVTPMSADHFFVGQTGAITDRIARFLRANL